MSGFYPWEDKTTIPYFPKFAQVDFGNVFIEKKTDDWMLTNGKKEYSIIINNRKGKGTYETFYYCKIQGWG